MKLFLAIIVIFSFPIISFAQAGELDSTFSGDGKVITSIGSSNDVASSIVVQSDGKIVVGGYANPGSNYDFALVRYITNGTLDSTFGYNGKVTTAGNLSDDRVYSVAIQSDGKILAAGYSVNNLGNSDFALVRYNYDGTLDNSFGSNGKVITAIGSNNDIAYSMQLQSDGKIILAGDAVTASNYDFVLVRYNTDGKLDTSFGTSGIITTAIGPLDEVVYSVAIQPDGKIVAVGRSFNSADDDFAIVRYNTNGILDTSFNTTGILTHAIGTTDDWAYSVGLQADGKIAVAGYSFLNDTKKFILVRYNPDGSLDSTFSQDGITNTTIDFLNDEEFRSLAIQSDGKIVVAGFSGKGATVNFALVRYNSNGTHDASFNADGKITTTFPSGKSEAFALAIQPDGLIVTAGMYSNGTSYEFALARYISGLNVGIINFSSRESSPLIYPNPINQTETLEYTLTKNESLTIALFDVNGKLIRNFISNEERTAGEHKETLDIGELSSGNYFLTLSNGSQKMTVKMVKQ